MKPTINKILLGGLLVASSSFALANGTPVITSFQQEVTPWWHGMFIGIEGGIDISRKMSFAPDYTNAPYNVEWKYPVFQDPNYWNADMGTAPLIGAKIGYFFNPQFSLDLSYDYRGNFKWNRSASLPTGDWVNEALRTGVDNIHSNIIMLNGRFLPNLDWGNFKPFVSAGAGIAFNYVGKVNEKTLSADNPFPSYKETNSHSTTSFAWQAGAGIDYTFNDNAFVTLGYRFVDIGKIQSGDRITYSPYYPSDVGDSITPLTENHPHLNEIYLSLNYKF
ncbi:MAG: outer membrane beta-barrel protein [Gammaproteobacteria bacterium]|nr:outer membrane beta-barrel protein [Gammaproteobacteria bacterium]